MEIWSDNQLEAAWFKTLDGRLAEAPVYTIGARGRNPVMVENLIAYDRPDIIFMDEQNPILVLEKTREVPTGHNVGQRMARIARSAELGVPAIFFLPFSARKHGRFSSICNVNARLLTAMRRMTAIHQTPILPVSWPADSEGRLVTDGSENNQVSALVSGLLDGSPNPWTPGVLSYLEELRVEERSRIEAFPGYSLMPKSVSRAATQDFLSGFDLSEEDEERLQSRPESLVYTIRMKPDKCKRQDPYTGTQFVYDYVWLREGPAPGDRDGNLILSIPEVDVDTWQKSNPNDPLTKSCNWYLIADAIALSDGIIYLNQTSAHE